MLFFHWVVVKNKTHVKLSEQSCHIAKVSVLSVVLIILRKKLAFLVDGQGGMNVEFKSINRYLTRNLVSFQMVGVSETE